MRETLPSGVYIIRKRFAGISHDKDASAPKFM